MINQGFKVQGTKITYTLNSDLLQGARGFKITNFCACVPIFFSVTGVGERSPWFSQKSVVVADYIYFKFGGQALTTASLSVISASFVPSLGWLYCCHFQGQWK